MKNCGHETQPPNISVQFSRSIRNELAIARGTPSLEYQFGSRDRMLRAAQTQGSLGLPVSMTTLLNTGAASVTIGGKDALA